jgi:phytoene dehydrogenase-like protein
MSKCYDTVVIGTGIGGLTAGLSLQRQGYSVLLLEAGKQFGGMLNPFARKKYLFDVGLHYVGQAGAGEALRTSLDSLGLEEVGFREINPACIDRYVFRDYEVRLVKGIDCWGDVLAADFPKEEKNIRRFFKLMKCVNLIVNDNGGFSLKKAATIMPFTGNLVRLFKRTFGELLGGYFTDPLLKNAFAGCGGALGLPPGRMSALAAILILNYYLNGAYYPTGGSGAIRDAYVKALRNRGAELMRNRTVVSIKRRPDGKFEVYTQQEECFVCRSVVSNVDVVETLNLMQGFEASRRIQKKAMSLRPSLSSFCVFLATDLDLTRFGISDANIWHYGRNSIDAAYGEAFENRLPEPPFFFLTAPTLKDPDTGRAPQNHHTLELITLQKSEPFKSWFHTRSKRRDGEYAALKEQTAERLIDEVQRYIPGLRNHLLHKESATPATVWHFVRSYEGGIYGPEHTPDQFAFGRFSPNIGIPGFYLAGSSVFGGGISLCLKSGLAAAGHTHNYLKRHGPVRI